MFTGIIECLGTIVQIKEQGTNRTFDIQSPLSPSLKVDQSLSHDGVCLTIERISADLHQVTAIEETLSKTTLQYWKTGDVVNLERSLQFNGRIDGHLVQGHVDTVALCINKVTLPGSWQFRFQVKEQYAPLMIEKGSISLNGISLTIFNVSQDTFDVAIIPYTYEHTTLGVTEAGDSVNIEFDMMGKYIERHLKIYQK